MIDLIFEAFLVGLVTLICGFIIKNILNYFKIDNIYIIFLSLGIFTHLFFEFLGLNKIYCKYGYACKL